MYYVHELSLRGKECPYFPFTPWAKMTIPIFVIGNKTQKPLDASLLTLKATSLSTEKTRSKWAYHSIYFTKTFFLDSIFTPRFLTREKKNLL